MANPSLPIWEVTAADPASGAEQRIEVEAPTLDEARQRIAATGLAVGPVRLVSLPPAVATPPPAASAVDRDSSQIGSEPRRISKAAPLGATVCPSCGGWHWNWYRPFAVAVAIALLFPLGMLALLTRRRFACTNCGLELPITAGVPREAVRDTDDDERTTIAIGVGVALMFAIAAMTQL